MPTPSIPEIGDNPSPKQIVDYLTKLQRDLQWLMQNLDDLNIRRLNAKVIISKTITADKMNVDELSAITANLGEITAGIIRGIQIFGSFFATAEEGYPRIEISGENKYVKLFLNATTWLDIRHIGDEGYPEIRFVRNGESFFLGYGALIDYPGISSSSPFSIFAWGGLYLTGANIINDWSMLINNTTSKTLQQELNSLTSAINSLTTALNNKANKGSSTSIVSNHNHGIPDGTVLMAYDGSPVTFFASGGHSHTQN